MTRSCGHPDDDPTSVRVFENGVTITTSTHCQCGQLLSSTTTRKIRPTEPGTGRRDD